MVTSKNVSGAPALMRRVRSSNSTSSASPIGRALPSEPANLDALVEAHQMRRRIDVDALAGRLQHCLEQRGGGTLAVGAGDVDDGRQAVLRIAELGEQRLDAAKRQVDAPRMQRLQFGQKLVTCAHGAP